MAISPKNVEYGSYAWLLREVGGFLGLGFDRNTWTADQEGRINSIVQSGYQQFCFPPPLMRVNAQTSGDVSEVRKDEIRKSPHVWSFMSPMSSLWVMADEDVYALPANMASMMGEFTAGDIRVPIVPEVHLRALISHTPASGNPQYCAVRPKSPRGWEVLFYPKPSRQIELAYRYTISPDPLGDENSYPVCGNEHAETLLQSCLSIAEERDGKQTGASSQKYMERLNASIHIDKQAGNVTETYTWKDDKANSLNNLIGQHLGYGPNEDTWTTGQTAKIKEAVRQGKRNFILPPLLPGEKRVHEWSFLRPFSTLNLQAGVFSYDMPDDFSSLYGPMIFVAGAAVVYPSIQITGAFELQRRQQLQTASSRPFMAALQVKEGVQDVGTKYEVLFFPTPDEAYELKFQYRINPDNDEVAQGGNEHFQTVLASCKASADELEGVSNSPHRKIFMEKVAQSIFFDRQSSTPDTLGYNADRSDIRYSEEFSYHDHDVNIVTYTGYNP